MQKISLKQLWFKVVLLCLVVIPRISTAQTNPIPFSLSSGNYLLSDWLSTNPAGTYPVGMYFHTGSIANPVLATTTNGDYANAYNLSSGPRVFGLGFNGFYITNTLTEVPSVGAAVLAINSVGRSNINVSFQAATHLSGNPANIRLQYRNSIYTNWVDVPGPVEYVSNGATSASPTSYSINLSNLTSNAVDNRPGLQLRWKYYFTSGTSPSNCAIRLDEFSVASTAIANPVIATGQITNSIFCLTPTESIAVNIPFNYVSSSSFPIGTLFTAELSDASGVFPASNPTVIGSIISNGTGSQIINGNFSANTLTGTAYRVRVVANSLGIIGTNNASDITIKRSPTDVTNPQIIAGGNSATINWAAPLNCFEDFLVIGRSGNNHTGIPVGDGSSYNASTLFGNGTAFGGGYVVYKGNGYNVEITGLKGDSTYYFTVWARYHNDWIGGTVLIVTPPSINQAVYNSRKILQAEYFWNNDPGQGNATPLIAVDGNLNSALEELFANGINVPKSGQSSFCLRVKNATGVWGPIFSTVVNVDVNDVAQLQNVRRVSQAEYFWNNDPGAGAGSVLIAFDGNYNQAIEQLIKNGIVAPKNGQNTFNIRIKDSDNNWGPKYSTLVNVDSVDVMTSYSIRKVSQGEYFWNSDPGTGVGTALIAFDGNYNQALESAFKSNIQVPRNGQNTLNVRFKDRDNLWSNVFSTSINVDSVDVMLSYTLRKIKQAEYFWNNDPGQDNAVPLLAFDGNLDQALESLFKNGIQAPRNGQNTFNIRVKDRDNTWGALFSTSVNVDSVDVMNTYQIRKITQAEFYWNVDPGQGSAIALIAFDGQINQAFEQITKQNIIAPKKGVNLLAVRVKDRDNNWGPDFKTIVNVDSVDSDLTFRTRKVKRVEFFFDQDPGQGNATLMTLSDGYGDSPLEQAIRNGISILPNGVHLLGLRTLDRDNTWGPTFKTTFSVDTLAQNSFQVYTNPITNKICKGGSITLRALGALSYNWSPSVGLNVTVGDSIIASPSVTTTYMVVGTNALSQTDTAYVTVQVQDSAKISNLTSLIFCQGDSVVLQSNVPYGNYWNTGATTSSISVKTTGNWILATDNECGVSYDTIKTINQTPVLTSTQNNVTCFGGNNGNITVNVASDTIPAQNSPGLLISELHTNPSGNDSPFEWVELIATDYINFAITPYTIILSNNSPASSKGWMQGGVASPIVNSTYAFQATTGSVSPGDVVYVGGSSMVPAGTKLRVINTATTTGDGGLGGASLLNGVLGNGGGLADGVAVFHGLVSALDSNSVPADAIFFGSSIGGAALADTSKGFTVPNNDRYAGGHLRTNSFLAPDPLSGYLRASGTFNRTTGIFSIPRTWTTGANYTNASSALNVTSNVLFSWSNGAPTKSISNLNAGLYTVTVTSALGCTTISSYQITQPEQIHAVFTVTNASCYDGNNGQVSVAVSGGVAPYNYVWSNGATTLSVTGLIAGTYTLTITDANGCSSQNSCTVSQPPAILITGFNPGIGNSGTSVTIKGSGFTGVNAVYFDTTSSTGFIVSGDTQIVAMVPLYASSGPIKLINTVGCMGLSTANFQYVLSFANIHLKIFLQGFYLGNGLMEPALVNSGVSSIFNEVDTVTAFIADQFSPGNILHSEKGVLNIYGDVFFNFPGIYIGQAYYIGVRHRNSIETWSKIPIMLQQQTYLDFTD